MLSDLGLPDWSLADLGLSAFGTTELALAVIALLAAGMVKGVIGIGTPLVGVPALTLLIDPASAAAAIAVPSLAANVWQLRDGDPIATNARRFWPLILGLLLGVPVGAWWLASGNAGSILGVIGALVFAFVLMRLTRPTWTLPPRLERPVGWVTGLLGGCVGGMSMIFGPFVITYLVSLQLGKDRFVGSIALIYLLCSAGVLVAFVFNGLMTPARTTIALAAVIPILTGVALGRGLRAYVSAVIFERLLLVTLMIIASVLIHRAVS
jgi:uncharacterized membrane protein YfcA